MHPSNITNKNNYLLICTTYYWSKSLKNIKIIIYICLIIFNLKLVINRMHFFSELEQNILSIYKSRRLKSFNHCILLRMEFSMCQNTFYHLRKSSDAYLLVNSGKKIYRLYLTMSCHTYFRCNF